jgi:DNA ligase D-like protein (predicted 3'-phosphoesterase)
MMKAKKSSLETYRKQRDFTSTPEPKGSKKKKLKKEPIFVIQKHKASHLHYDFRLEIDGVLRSWALPKGPSTNTKEKHLALETEDHPLEYAEFEGVIPEGNYGAGTVMVWDIGTYRNMREKKKKPRSMQDAYQEGKIEVFLEGEKLRGGYALVRMRNSDDKWLFVKMQDEYAGKPKNPLKNLTKSALTGRTMTEIKKGVKHE